MWVGQEQMKTGGSSLQDLAFLLHCSQWGAASPQNSPYGMDPTVPQKPTPNSQFYPFIHDISELGDTVMSQSGFPEAGSMDGYGFPTFLLSQSLSKGKRYLQNPSWE